MSIRINARVSLPRGRCSRVYGVLKINDIAQTYEVLRIAGRAFVQAAPMQLGRAEVSIGVARTRRCERSPSYDKRRQTTAELDDRLSQCERCIHGLAASTIWR